MKRGQHEPIEIICLKCRFTEIVYIPVDEIPPCPKCNSPMSIRELLDEGKSY